MHGYTDRKDDYNKRLRRIEGQVRGLQRAAGPVLTDPASARRRGRAPAVRCRSFDRARAAGSAADWPV
jgi:hypothetical protein